MKGKVSKLLATVLSLTLVFSFLSIPAYADEPAADEPAAVVSATELEQDPALDPESSPIVPVIAEEEEVTEPVAAEELAEPAAIVTAAPIPESVVAREIVTLAGPTITGLNVVRTSETMFTINFNSDEAGMLAVWVYQPDTSSEYYNDPFVVGLNSVSFALKGANLDGPATKQIDINWNTASSGSTQLASSIPAWVAPSSAKDITSFAIGASNGTISGTNIAVTVPYGTNVTAITPTIVHNGTGITPSGAQDFTNPVTYEVTAEDASTKIYIVTVTVSPAASSKDITSFSLSGVQGTFDALNISVRLPYGTDITALTPTIVHNGVGVSPTGAQDFSGTVVYTVTAQDGTTKTYAVNVSYGPIPVAVHFGTWTGEGTVTAKINVPLVDFVGLYLNGTALAVSDYEAIEGSTVITLTETYLKTLGNGDYVFSAQFADGAAALPLKVDVAPATVTPPPSTTPTSSGLPQTGDSALPIAWAVTLGISGLALLALSQRKRLLRWFAR